MLVISVCAYMNRFFMGKRKNVTISPVEKTVHTETKSTKKSRKASSNNSNNNKKNNNKTENCSSSENMAQNTTHTVSSVDTSGLQNAQIPQTPQQFAVPTALQYSPFIGSFNPLNTSSPVMSTIQPQTMANMQGSDPILQTMLAKIESIEKNMGQLNEIRMAVSDLTVRFDDMNKKISDIENSQQFLSEKYECVTKENEVNKTNIKKLQDEHKSLEDETIKLKASRDSLSEDIINLKCRSMRDNMLFFGIPEISSPLSAEWSRSEVADLHNAGGAQGTGPAPTQQATTSTTLAANHNIIENCEAKVHQFLSKVLNIQDPESKVHIDRAHRVGPYSAAKTRPIVAKFSDTASKLVVKDALKTVNLRNSPYNATEQYPPEVQQRRRELIPVMIQARKDGKRATLVRDKLIINGREYKASTNSNSITQ